MTTDTRTTVPRPTTATPAVPGRPMDLRLLGTLGAERDQAQADAAAKLDAAVAELEAAGDQANIALAARLLGVSRDTLYARLEQRAGGAA